MAHFLLEFLLELFFVHLRVTRLIAVTTIARYAGGPDCKLFRRGSIQPEGEEELSLGRSSGYVFLRLGFAWAITSTVHQGADPGLYSP